MRGLGKPVTTLSPEKEPCFCPKQSSQVIWLSSKVKESFKGAEKQELGSGAQAQRLGGPYQ